MVQGLKLTVPDGLVARLAQALKPLDEADAKVAFAESCTAGLCASAVSSVEGLGHVLDASFVTYSPAAKARLLDIPSVLIEREGAVSEAVARRMAEGALLKSDADLAVSVTGFAGPAGPADEEGLVHFALARGGHETQHRVERLGSIGQDAVRLKALEVVIDLLAMAGSTVTQASPR